MNAISNRQDQSSSFALELLIARHGTWPILFAVLSAMVRRRPGRRRLTPDGLNSHLRRDVGLLPEPESRAYWRFR